MKPHPRPVFASIVALALVLALAGGAYALGKSRGVEIAYEPTGPAGTPSPSATASHVAAETGVTKIDAAWNLYTDVENGFSMRLPATSEISACAKNATTGYFTTEAIAKSPVVYLPDGKNVYITNADYTWLGSPKMVGDQANYSTCATETTTIARITEAQIAIYPAPRSFYIANWHVRTMQAADDAALTSILKKEYGSGCSIGEKKATEQDGTFDVSIMSDGKDLGESECPVNYIVAIKYNPAKQKVALWNIGQDASFVSGETQYDEAMVRSFRFL